LFGSNWPCNNKIKQDFGFKDTPFGQLLTSSGLMNFDQL